jgi:hypothetical protein
MSTTKSTQPLILYSVNTRLSFGINERYYKGLHYVWCTDVFDSRTHQRYGPNSFVPPTSNPCQIFTTLLDEVKMGDLHSNNIRANKRGIANGAVLKLSRGIINEQQHREIMAIISKAQIADFQPFIYLIPYNGVINKITTVPVAKCAHPLSREFIIEDLLREEFDVVEVPYGKV